MPASLTVHAKSRTALIGLKNHSQRARTGVRQALYDIGENVQDEIRRLIKTGPKTGRLYRRPGGRVHQASAPGQSPANDTGKLVSSVNYSVYSWQRMEVGDREFYGKFLERGTKKMAPRPHVGKAVNNKAGNAVRILNQRIKEHTVGKRR